MQLLNGGFEASACTFILAKYLFQVYEKPATYFWTIWLVISLPYLLIRTMFYMPKKHIIEENKYTGKGLVEREKNLLSDDKSTPSDEELGLVEVFLTRPRAVSFDPSDFLTDTSTTTDLQKMKNKKLLFTAKSHPRLNPESMPNLAIGPTTMVPNYVAYEKSFIGCIKTKTYLLHICWFVLMDFWNVTFYTAFLSWASWLSDRDNHKINMWINAWSIFQFCGMPFGMLVGGVYDRVKSNSNKKAENDLKSSSLLATASVTAITTLVGILSAFLASFKIEWVQWITFVLQLTYRSSLYGNNAQALLGLYPTNQFGKLYGFTFLATFIGAEMTTLVIKLAMKFESFTLIYRCYSLLMSLGFTYPAYLYYKSKKATY